MNYRYVIALLASIACVPALQGCVAVGGAAIVGTAMVAEDRRSPETMADDQKLEIKVSSAIKEKYGKDEQVYFSVTSFNRFVMLTGEAPTEAIKKDIGVLALGVEGVRNVQNEITIGPVASFGRHSNDAWITTQVKSRMATGKDVQVNYVKVVTENGVVYLMGMVTPAEANAATEIASTTNGVEKVVRVFEISESYAKPKDTTPAQTGKTQLPTKSQPSGTQSTAKE